MDEGDLHPKEARPRRLVDQLRPGTRKLGERPRKIAHLICDVVHPRSPLREEAADRRIGAEGLEELDTPLTDAQRGRADALLLDDRQMLHLGAEQALVRLQSRVEVVDSNSKMVDSFGLHRGEATGRPTALDASDDQSWSVSRAERAYAQAN